ncbi:MAG TPA: phosphate ABC transporter ATP-binding protein [Anaerolineae bacterium]|nr:phosphate ABC transporter ATP-binding protein [Anaerolineae bacterium]
MNPILRLEAIRHSYGEHFTLRIPELSILPGEIFAVVGPSGAGKSTLLRILNFLEKPQQGRVYFHERAYTASNLPIALRRRMVAVFQQPLLLNASVWRNVSYGLRVRGSRNGHEAIQQALDDVRLSHLARQPVDRLSGGEAQRVSLARALVLNPEVLFLDEPTANLDPSNVRIIEEIIRKANQARGTTVVLITHNIWQARRLAHRVALLFDGEIIETADVDAFFHRPQDPRTAAFLSGDLIY